MKKKITDKQVAKVLDEALALMNDSGAHWLQGSYKVTDRKTREMSFCSVGAIRQLTTYNEPLRKRAYSALASQIPGYYSYMNPRNAIEKWNDSRSDWHQIVEGFTKASQKLRNS